MKTFLFILYAISFAFAASVVVYAVIKRRRNG